MSLLFHHLHLQHPKMYVHFDYVGTTIKNELYSAVRCNVTVFIQLCSRMWPSWLFDGTDTMRNWCVSVKHQIPDKNTTRMFQSNSSLSIHLSHQPVWEASGKLLVVDGWTCHANHAWSTVSLSDSRKSSNIHRNYDSNNMWIISYCTVTTILYRCGGPHFAAKMPCLMYIRSYTLNTPN